jgi:hypothetical protein
MLACKRMEARDVLKAGTDEINKLAPTKTRGEDKSTTTA